MFGTPLAGFLVSRFAARRVLPAALVGSAVTFCRSGPRRYNPWHSSLVCLGLAGFFLGVASSGLIALGPLLYSTAIRSTGVGWAMGLGRLGAIVGPLAIGLLVSRGWQIGDTFAALGMPALCAALFTSLIAINRARGAAAADRVADGRRRGALTGLTPTKKLLAERGLLINLASGWKWVDQL